MRCPRCNEFGQEVTSQGDTSRVYVCNTPGCRVAEFGPEGIKAEASGDDPEPE